MAGIFKRLGNGKEHGENESGTKLYGSLRALRSPLRSNTPTKRRSRSLELPNEVPVRESGHSRYPSAQESSFRRPTSPQTHSTPSHRLQSGVTESRAVSPTVGEISGNPAVPKKKKRGNLLSRALSSLRNSAVYPGHSAMPTNTPSKSGSHPTSTHSVSPPSIPISQAARSSSPLSSTQPRIEALPRSSANKYLTGEVGRQPPQSESERSTPASEGQTSASASASGSNPSRHYLPLSTSEPIPRSSRTAQASGHVPNSTSDPGPGRSDAASPPPDAQTQRESRDEAYQRLVKVERRKSPLARIIPPLFRRNSADIKADSLIGRVGAPMKRVSTREDSRAVSRNASVEFHDPSTSRTKITSVGSASQLARPRAGRHRSFDFEQQQSKTTPVASAAPEGKVRFVEPVIEEGSHDGDSGVSGLRSDAEFGAGRDKQTEVPSSSSRTDLGRRSHSRHPPVSIDASRHTRRAKLRDTSPDMAAPARDSGSTPLPLGTTYTSHGLPLFSFEPINPSPSPSATSFAAHPSARPAPQASPIDSRERRRNKGRSLDLAIGLTWAPKKVREDALLTFGHGGQSSKSKWGADARMSEVLLTSDLQELGVPPKQRVMNAFRQVLDEPGYLTFKRYCRRYEVGALPLRGPTGILGHLERLLDTAAEIPSREKQDLLDQFAQFAAGR